MNLTVLLHMQIDVTLCTTILRPVHTLQDKEEPSSAAKPPHITMESSAAQIATTSSTSDDSGTIQAGLLQEVQVPAESVHFVIGEPLAASHCLLQA